MLVKIDRVLFEGIDNKITIDGYSLINPESVDYVQAGYNNGSYDICINGHILTTNLAGYRKAIKAIYK